MDISRATELTPEVESAIEKLFRYEPWNEEQIEKGGQVRAYLQMAAKIIIQNVPPCPDRTVALRKITEARMDCNSAITHHSK